MRAASEHPSRWLEATAARHPDGPALIAGDRVWRFDELLALLTRAAASYADAGLVPGATTAIAADSRLRIALGVLMGLHAGWPILPLPRNSDDLDECFRAAGVGQVLADDETPAAQNALAAEFPIGWLESPPAARSAAASVIRADGTLLYLRTSGTTGDAKIVRLSAQNLSAAIVRSCERLDVRAGDCWLACLPAHHVGGLSVILRAVNAGAGAVIMEKFRVSDAARLLTEHDVTHASVVPAMLAGLVAELDEPPASLRCVLVGGGPLSAEVFAAATRRGWPVRISYGMTETCAHATIYDGAAESWRPGNVGTPMPGTSIDLLDESGEPGASIGRIRVSGEQVMCGYATAHTDAASGLPDGAFVTSDLGRFDDAGNLFVLGRADAAFTSGGYLIHPESLEAVVAACPGVEAIVFSGLPDPEWEHRIVAVFSGPADAAAVADYCRNRLEPHEQPRDVARWQSVPRAELGKPDRAAVRARLMRE